MPQIVSKLNLNKTPSIVENNSLIFAKNIRVDIDGSIHRDYGISPLSIRKEKDTDNDFNYLNIIRKIKSDIDYYEYDKSYYVAVANKLNTFIIENIGSIVGVIADSNDFYIFLYGDSTLYEISLIVKYTEETDRFSFCNCNWNYSGGTITGCIITNLTGDKILNIGETNTNNIVPFKSINLTISDINDNEAIYTQTPNVPLTNLNFLNTFAAVIPNGVYQFFVRYRISENFYTNWFPASKELFAGNKNTVVTSFGKLEYLNTHRDSDNSFTFNVEHLIEENKSNYKDYQIGFILSHDDAIYARAWKHFSFEANTINFDYKSQDSEELEIIDFIKPTYGLYNVGNITSFKNKLYISNYTETNFNEDLQSIANDIQIHINAEEGNETYNGKPIHKVTVKNKQVISGLKIGETVKYFYGENSIFRDIICRPEGNINEINYISEAILDVCNNVKGNIEVYSEEKEGIKILCKIDSLEFAEKTVKEKYKNSKDGLTTYKHEFDEHTIKSITFDDIIVSKDNLVSKLHNTPRYLTESCNWMKSDGSVGNVVIIKIKRECRVTETKKYNNNNGTKPYNPDDNPGYVDSTSSTKNKEQQEEISISRPTTNNEGYSEKSREFTVQYYQNIKITFLADSSKLNFSDASTLINKTTLIPYQRYKFYVHFVKSSGEITNGYECFNGQELIPDYQAKCKVLYPTFKNINIPDGYEACFFSIFHTGVITSTIFDITNSPEDKIKEGRSFDINMMLVPNSKNITIKQGTFETNTGTYHYSSDASYSRYFGADGVITFNQGNIDKFNIDNNSLAYSITDYVASDSENIELIKCTPFITKDKLKDISSNIKSCYLENNNMNLLGYICDVSPLNKERCFNYYSDGSSIYYKSTSGYTSNDFVDGSDIKLDELYKYADAEIEDYKKLANFGLISSVNNTIYSNYNLNFIALSEEPKMTIKTYYNTDANNVETSEKAKSTGVSTFLRLLSSQLLSDIYELPSMYKTYTRKTYSIYKDDEINKFDNTVRSSILYGDENKVNILTFDANDYYNIPTNRGIIVNLVSVGDAIIVHTKDSMFKFIGSNNITSSNGEILTTESKPFDTGVSEVFGSDFGFAGIQYKQDHIITENGYIFFDRDSKIVYAYAGNGQISKLSDSIEKLFNHRPIYNITFANDYYNNRFFLSIMFYEDVKNGNEVKRVYYPVTLSFNFSEQIKSFVSLHDFYYHYAFNTKTNCYFLTTDNKDICAIDKNNLGVYTKVELLNDKLYPKRRETFRKQINTFDDKNEIILKTHNINSFNSIVDVIYNVEYERIKTLNSISWCGKQIKKEFVNVNPDSIESLCMAEPINTIEDIPCSKIRIYTDTCATNLLDCEDKSNNSINNYKYPRYNQGLWTFNYFRNILNAGRENKVVYSGDNNSLIEGKYFVVRFVFDKDFKLETLYFNYNNKI